MPLDVDKGIELPQLELISTKNDDCTTEYSTGKKALTNYLESIQYLYLALGIQKKRLVSD